MCALCRMQRYIMPTWATHLILWQHEEDDVVVLEGAVRSWAPIQARCLRWGFPVFTPADDLDPRLLRSERPKRPKKQDTDEEDGQEAPTWDAEHFAMAFVTKTPQTRNAILFAANEVGLSDYKGERLLRKAEGTGLVHRWSQGRNRPSLYANIPQPNETEGSK